MTGPVRSFPLLPLRLGNLPPPLSALSSFPCGVRLSRAAERPGSAHVSSSPCGQRRAETQASDLTWPLGPAVPRLHPVCPADTSLLSPAMGQTHSNFRAFAPVVPSAPMLSSRRAFPHSLRLCSQKVAFVSTVYKSPHASSAAGPALLL